MCGWISLPPSTGATFSFMQPTHVSDKLCLRRMLSALIIVKQLLPSSLVSAHITIIIPCDLATMTRINLTLLFNTAMHIAGVERRKIVASVSSKVRPIINIWEIFIPTLTHVQLWPKKETSTCWQRPQILVPINVKLKFSLKTQDVHWGDSGQTLFKAYILLIWLL